MGIVGAHIVSVFSQVFRAICCAIKKSVPSGFAGPCCSVEPIGITTSVFFFRYSWTSSVVISSRSMGEIEISSLLVVLTLRMEWTDN
jgi:hypothetical protein